MPPKSGYRAPLLAALGCLFALAGTGAIAILTPVGHAHDAAALQGFTGLTGPRLDSIANLVSHTVDLLPYVGMMALAVALAVGRGRPRVALAVVGLAFVAPATSELLKPLIAHFRATEQIGDARIISASWPSGHATAAMTLALGAVMVVPGALRPLVAAAGGGLAIAVGYSILILGWHLPSDVLAGFLVAAVWALLAMVALRAAQARWPARSGRRAAARMSRRLAPVRLRSGRPVALAGRVALAGLAAASPVALALAVLRLGGDAQAESTTFYASAAAIAALAGVLSASFLALSRR